MTFLPFGSIGMNGDFDRVKEFQIFKGGRCSLDSGCNVGCRQGGCWRAVAMDLLLLMMLLLLLTTTEEADNDDNREDLDLSKSVDNSKEGIRKGKGDMCIKEWKRMMVGTKKGAADGKSKPKFDD